MCIMYEWDFGAFLVWIWSVWLYCYGRVIGLTALAVNIHFDDRISGWNGRRVDEWWRASGWGVHCLTHPSSGQRLHAANPLGIICTSGRVSWVQVHVCGYCWIQIKTDLQPFIWYRNVVRLIVDHITCDNAVSRHLSVYHSFFLFYRFRSGSGGIVGFSYLSNYHWMIIIIYLIRNHSTKWNGQPTPVLAWRCYYGGTEPTYFTTLLIQLRLLLAIVILNCLAMSSINSDIFVNKCRKLYQK